MSTNTKPPATAAAVRSRWSAREEAQLQELIERRSRIMSENREPVWVLAAGLPNKGTMDENAWNDIVTDWLIANADALRDALEPFDSGVRAARSAT